MPKQTSTKPCALCGKDVPQEAELQLFKHFLNYTDAEGSLVHSCKSKAFYEARSRKQKSSKIERAVERLISHPRDKRSQQVLMDFRSEKLVELAGKPGVAGLAAAGRLLKEYVGPTEETAPQVDVIQMPPVYVFRIEEAKERLKSLPVKMIESATDRQSDSESKPKPVSKPVREPTRRGADDPQPPGGPETDYVAPMPIRNGQMQVTNIDIRVFSHNGKLMVVDPDYRLRQRGPYG